MSEFEKITKNEAFDFIGLFEENTKELSEPMIGWYGDGAISVEDALNDIDRGLEPEGVSIIAKRPDEDYWESVFIHKNEDGYLVTTGDMSDVPDYVVDTIPEAMEQAQKSLIQYIGD